LPDSATSDEALVQAAGKGDLEAFEEVVRRHQTWAWRIAYRFLGDEAEAADLVQESFLRLLDASSRYHPTARFRTYFYRIITRLCLDFAKKKKPLYVNTVPETPDTSLAAGEAMMRTESASAVGIALDNLPPNQRIAIIYRYFDDMNYEGIAEALGTSAKAVERLLARGRERLRNILGTRNDLFHF